jgi:hypothetical protein
MNPLGLPWAALVEGLATAIIKQAPDTAEIGAGPGEQERLMAQKLKADGWTAADVRAARKAGK